MATATADTYSVASGVDVYVGRQAPDAPVAPLNTWVTLSLTPYSYVPPRDTGGVPRYHYSNIDQAQTDAGGAVSLAIFPVREFSRPSLGADGYLYFHGGLHTGYPGNDILKIKLGSPLTAVQIDRPHVLQMGDIGYSTSATDKLYKDYGTAFTTPERVNAQPYGYHNYCKNTWHARLGYLLTNAWVYAWDGSGYPISTQTQHTAYDGRAYCTLRIDEVTKLYSLVSASPQAWVLQDLSDYCPAIDGVLGLSQNDGNFNFLEMTAANGDTWTLARTVTANGTTGGGQQFNGGNGTVMRLIEAQKFLVLHAAVGDGSLQRMWTYNHANGATAGVTLPASAEPGGNFHLARREATRTMYCVVHGNPLRVFHASFDSLSSWTELTMTSTPAFPTNAALNSAQFGRDCAFVYGNALYLFDFYANTYRAMGLPSA